MNNNKEEEEGVMDNLSTKSTDSCQITEVKQWWPYQVVSWINTL